MRGFFGFLLIFVLLLLLTFVSMKENNFYSELNESKTLLIEAEQNSKERTILENNTDKIVFLKLKEQVNKQNFLIKSVLNEINHALEKYLIGKTKATNFGVEKGEISLMYLNENSTAFLIEKEGITYAEYTFTCGLERTNEVSKKIGEEMKVIFTIPCGYTVRVIG
jgi:hypothetical protein